MWMRGMSAKVQSHSSVRNQQITYKTSKSKMSSTQWVFFDEQKPSILMKSIFSFIVVVYDMF